jgi:gamma-glutamyltranspeptidase/glutathione hydrolase
LLSSCVVGGDQAMVRRLAVAADEPQAAVIGREILSQGGNAADAAVATALTMAVTLPSRVGLGGGGACLVHDPAEGTVRALDFLPRAPQSAEGRTASTSGFLRGLAALHATYGSLRWETLVSSAENAARFGHPAARSLARDIELAARISGPEHVAGILPGGPEGPPREGDTLVQPELAAVLGQLRSGGVGAFYNGALGRQYAEAATAAGYALPLEDLRGYRPEWREPVSIGFGNDILHFAPMPEVAGPEQALIWHMLTEVRPYGSVPAEERLHLLVEAQRRATAAPGGITVDGAAARRLMEGYDPNRATAPVRELAGATSFGATLSILSQTEMSVVCGFTNYGLFGSGQLASGTGIVIAPAPTPGVNALGGLALLANQPKRQVVFAGAGADVLTALTEPLAEVVLRGTRVDQALALGRAAPDFTTPAVLADEFTTAEDVRALETRGHQVWTVPGLGRATAIWCDWDRAASKICYAASDPRGAGLASATDFAF